MAISNKIGIKHFGLKKDIIKKLGIENFVYDRKFNTINEILKSDTGMIIANCTENAQLNNLNLYKNRSYVMPLNIFTQNYKNKDKSKKIFKPSKTKYNDLFKRYYGHDLNNKKLLISRMGGLGDIVVTQSVIKHIKEKYPTCEITYATQAHFLDLFDCFPSGLINNRVAIPYDKEIMMKHNYHLLFIHSIENCYETNSMNCFDIFQKVTGLDYNSRNYIPELKPLNYIDKQLNLQFTLPGNLVLIHMESTTQTRKYPYELWAQIIAMLHDRGYNVGIIDAKNKAADVNNLIIKMGVDKNKTLNLATISENISTAITIASKCVGSIVIDSSFGHISGALRLPCVALCGPYTAYNVYDAYPTVFGAEKASEWNECGKAPCHINSQNHLCPFVVSNMYPGCLASIPPRYIIDLFEQQIEKFKK